jgi:signal transduction histidine kinase
LAGTSVPFAFLFLISSLKRNLFARFDYLKKYFFASYLIGIIVMTALTQYVLNYPGSEKEIVFNTLPYLYFLVTVTIYFLSSFYLIFLWWMQTDGQERRQAVLIFWGSLIPVVPSFLVNILLPYFGFFQYYFLGPFTSMFLVFFTVFAILKYRLFEMRIFASKFIKYILFSVYSYIVFYSIIFLFNYLFGSVVAKESLTLGVLFAPVFVFLLFKLESFGNLINFKIFGNLNKYEQVFEKVSEFINTNTDNKIIIEYIQNTSSNFINSEFVKFFNISVLSEKSRQQLVGICKSNEELYFFEKTLTIEGKRIKPAYISVIESKKGERFVFLVGRKLDKIPFAPTDITFLKSILGSLIYVHERAQLYKNLEEYATTLEKEVKKQTEKIELQKKSLEELLKVKDETLHIVNHQVNTPISVIRSALQAFQDKIWTQERFIGVIDQELDRIRVTIAQFLAAKKAEDGKIVLNKNKADLGTLVKSLVSEKMLLKKVRENGIQIKWEEQSNLPAVVCDIARITEVISNMLDNAVNYSTKDIQVSLKNVGKNVVVSVKDSGIGVPKDKINSLFERFVRLENAKKTRPDGTGLGLYVCKQIVEAHGGKIWVESEGEGQGSTFFVSLPI